VEREQGPIISDVKREDLEQFSRCRVLYGQAFKRGIVKESEANFLTFIAAAVRAKSIKNGDPVKVIDPGGGILLTARTWV